MSGQYPPPNPSHPFSRAAHHQPAPNLPPWGHRTPQPSGMNVLGNPMNFFGPPHAGLPSRAATQPWGLQTRPKPLDSGPLYGLQMMRAPGEQRGAVAGGYQQESMDLSSHAPADLLRNGTELNGEDSVATSVIAPNPLRAPDTSALNCSKAAEAPTGAEAPSSVAEGGSLNTALLNKQLTSTCMKSDTSELITNSTLDTSENISASEIKEVKTVHNISEPVPLTGNSDNVNSNNLCQQTNKLSTNDRTIDCTIKPFKETVEAEESIDLLRKSVENFGNSSFTSNPPTLNTSQSFMDSTLSVDTDDSKLVVAESSADDIFGTSPDPLTAVLQETDAAESSKQPSTTSRAETEQPSAPAEPHPSVENVEILLENMFNSQEETSCSSQTSNSSIPQSVIVTRTPLETAKPEIKASTPLKAEELAMTLAADDPLETVVKEEAGKTDIMDEIEKKLELLTEKGLTEQPQSNIPFKIEQSSYVPLGKPVVCNMKEENDTVENQNTNSLDVKSESISSIINHSVDVKVEQSTAKSEVDASQSTPDVKSCAPGPSGSGSAQGTSSNPFIEVESELEKMFAGIVEPAEEGGSDSVSQPLSSEPKKSVTQKKPAARRKKTNSRRASDNSVFGGSSEETLTPKKKGRKRANEGVSEKGSKKSRGDGAESSKKGKLVKEVNSDKLKGPFVRIEGSKESPASVVVVNSGVRADDEDGTEKANARRKHMAQRNEWVTRKSGPAYSSSAMSARYNSDKADLSWVCVFCKRGPHCAGGLGGEPAGDLFGPYRVPATPPHDVLPCSPGTVTDHELREEQKRRGGGKLPKSLRASGGVDQFLQKAAKKGKRSQSSDSLEPQCGLLGVEGGYEVWMHGQCAEWAPGLSLISSQLVGLEDAVWAALRVRCTHCQEPGAGLSCMVRSCPARVHYPCAVLCGWLLDCETFVAHCSAHRTRLRPS